MLFTRCTRLQSSGPRGRLGLPSSPMLQHIESGYEESGGFVVMHRPDMKLARGGCWMTQTVHCSLWLHGGVIIASFQL